LKSECSDKSFTMMIRIAEGRHKINKQGSTSLAVRRSLPSLADGREGGPPRALI